MNLVPRYLTAEEFAQYGQVVELENAGQFTINNGLTTRYHDLFRIDAVMQDGYPIGSVFRTKPLPLPHRIKTMERHPLGSQTFIPLQNKPFLVLVGKAGKSLNVKDLKLFLTNGRQGISISRNTWHHHHIVLDHVQDFLVIDRGGQGENLEEIAVLGEGWLSRPIIT